MALLKYSFGVLHYCKIFQFLALWWLMPWWKIFDCTCVLNYQKVGSLILFCRNLFNSICFQISKLRTISFIVYPSLLPGIELRREPLCLVHVQQWCLILEPWWYLITYFIVCIIHWEMSHIFYSSISIYVLKWSKHKLACSHSIIS